MLNVNKSYIREFEATEALITLVSQAGKVSARVQKYNKDFSLPCISLSFPRLVTLEGKGPKAIAKKLETQFGVTNCYDLNDWRSL